MKRLFLLSILALLPSLAGAQVKQAAPVLKNQTVNKDLEEQIDSPNG